MRILLVLIPLSLVLLAFAIGAFIWAVRRGQFDDLDTPAVAVLADDDLHPAQPSTPVLAAQTDSAQTTPAREPAA